MGVLSRLFGAKSEIAAKPSEHALIMTFAYGGSTNLDPLFALGKQLESNIAAARAGE
jgi:hypothetical protein